MKSFYLSFLFLSMIAVAGCGGSGENELATDGVTADELAKYEEQLAAVSGGDSYADSEDGDDEEVEGDKAAE